MHKGGTRMINATSIRKSNIYFLHGENILSNMNNLSKFYRQESSFSENSLKINFFETLNKLQKISIPYKDDEILIEFDNQKIFDHLINKKVIEREDLEDDKHLFSTSERNLISGNINKALKFLKMLHPDLSYLIEQLTGTIICFKKSRTGGGTTSCALGLIWLNPHKDWTIVDYADALYHEFTHTSIFIDDMVNCMFLDAKACKKEDAFVTSAILKIKRPLDSAYHAAGVAVALMHFYYMINDKEKALSFLEPLKRTIYELTNKKEYLGKRGVESLNEMSRFVQNLDYESIHSTLSLNR